ncbi:NAD(+)/NADH kinase [Sinanaerobacter sp. ZZT-01]|uniref:NAD(+)/NADH kinase n=1 Tax=Sinanaerobacter sp. ZZT-01 TaxID=3111540 RepID=UPI002D7764D3|nr:NAD(+)/NADH kinase [Sinanaerobacter sp. ZZT-01]WRR93332.1 NAD(+)/NADH kinase [Sinanaerobacter sp. ZZT-01]
MEKNRIINIFANNYELSKEIKRILKQKLEKSGFLVPCEFNPDAELIVCVGGDGSFLKTLHKYKFPDIPFIGVNTGHLGFFQELHPDQLDEFIFKYKQKAYEVQSLKTVKAEIEAGENTYTHLALNEVIVKGDCSQSVHLNLSIGDSFIEKFSGDGLLIATPAGSTAYNYALGGSIIDPRLKILQVTPISPMNTTAYRSFTSSVILPADLFVKIYPEPKEGHGIVIVADGMEHRYGSIDQVKVNFAENIVKLLRFENYDFWTKVKSKFL